MNLRALQRKQGCTFVVTIHQPAPAVFDAFDSLVLLNYGRLAYWGPGRAAPLDFFAEQGFPVSRRVQRGGVSHRHAQHAR